MHWERFFQMRNNGVLGLDIGSSSIKMVQLGKDGDGYAVVAAGMADINADTSNGSDADINVVRAVRRCVKTASVQTQLAVCGVCGTEVAVRPFRFPSIPPEEIEGAVMLEASQVCPFNINDGVVDCQVIPDGQNTVQGILVAATKELVRKKTNLARQAFLKSVLIDVDGLALINCLKECEKMPSGKTLAILNVGSSYTTLAIIGNDSMPFIRDIAYAGNKIVNRIADLNGIESKYLIEKLSQPESADQLESEISDSLAQASYDLIADVSGTLRYYAANQKTVVEKIYVCGGFALFKEFVKLLKSKFTAEVTLWNPFKKISCRAGEQCEQLLQQKGPSMVVAAGLAMRSIC